MGKEKNETKVKEIVELYKRNLAKLMRRGMGSEVISLLHDSGPISGKEKNMYDVAKKSQTATSQEEVEVQRINFIFSLLTKVEREILINDYLLGRPTIWWEGRISRSTYYRLRKKACFKFISYYGQK